MGLEIKVLYPKRKNRHLLYFRQSKSNREGKRGKKKQMILLTKMIPMILKTTRK